MPDLDPAGAFNRSYAAFRQNQQTDADVAGQSAAGNFVKSLFNGSVPGAQPMQPPMGGQPQGASPMQPPMGGPPPQPMGGQPQPPQPQAIPAGGGMPQAPQNAVAALAQRLRSMVPGAQPMMPQAGQMPQAQAGAASPPPTPGGPPGGVPSSSQPPGGNPIQSLYGQMTLQQVAQGVVRSNPGIEKNPQALFSAMRQLMPLMRPDEAQYFRALQLQQQQQHNTAMEGIAQQRADTGDVRAATAGAQGQERIDLGKQKESRIAGQSQVRLDQGWQRLELSKQQLQRQITQGGQRNLLGQWRAVLDAQHKRATEIIQGGNTNVTLTDDQKKQLKEENDQYEGEIKAMRAGQGPGGSQPQGDAQPAGGAAKPGNVIKYDAQGNRITQPGGQGASPFESTPGKQSGITDSRVLSDAGPMPVRAGQQLAMAGEGDEPTLLTGETHPPSASPEMAEEDKRLQAPFAMTRSLGGGRPTPLMRPANENVKGLDDSRTQAELKKMRVEKKFEELRNRLLPPETREIPPDVLRAMKGYFGNLGFDYPGQALSAIRADIKAGSDPKAVWDIRPEDELQWRRIMDYIKKN